MEGPQIKTIGQLESEGAILAIQDGNHGEKHPKTSDYVEDGIPFVMASDIREGAVDLVGCSKIPPALAAKLRVGFAKTGDVLLTHKGSIGLTAIVPAIDHSYVMLTPQVTYYRLNRDLVDAHFLRYAFRDDGFRLAMNSLGNQSTRPFVSISAQRSLPIRIWPIRIQRRIAAVLSAYDDLIENNAKRIRVLEEMARAVYREWFVHFRHPGHAGASLPADWKRTTLGALVTIEKDSLDPRDAPDTEFDLHSFEACDLGRLPIPTMGQAIQSNKFRVPEDVVLLPKLNPHIPRVWMPFLEGDRPAICSTEFLVLKPRAGIPRSYVYAMVEGANFSAGLAQRADGTSNSHKRLKPDDVMSRPVVEPSRELLARFDEVASTQLRAVHTLRKKNRGLRAARDLLLPKLLSGDLSVDRIPDPAAAG